MKQGNHPGVLVRSERPRRLAALVLGIAAVLCLSALPGSAQVHWRAGDTRTPKTLSSQELTRELERLSQRPERRHAVVYLNGPSTSADREALRDAGVRLLSYLGGDAYFASLSSPVDSARVLGRNAVRHVEAIRDEWKLHPDLAEGLVRPWSILPADPANPETDADEPPATEETPTVALYVLFHRDLDAAAIAPAVLARHGGVLRSNLKSVNGAVIHLPADRIESFAAEDAVMYVEPPLPRFEELNDSNRARVEADTVQAPPFDLDGTGVTVLVYDGGQMFAHPDFGSRLTIGASDTDGISDHATHVGGTIGGDGSESGGQHRGMAPGVDFVSYGFQQGPGGLFPGFLYNDPGDLEADYTEAIQVHGADISNNSIGTNTAPNGYPCEWEGNYGVTGALIDAIARGSTGSPFRIVWANGNERSGSANCGNGAYTTAPPATAKNHITVGALNSEDDEVTSFTSWGPTDDGRLKPDVSAPGCQGSDDFGVTSTNSSGDYNVKCGTSMASPTTCGVAALLLQQYRLTFPALPDPRNSTLKAILANTAEDIENPGPDVMSGYGSIRATPAVQTVIDGNVVEALVGPGEVWRSVIVVDPADTELRVTLAWDDPPGTPNVSPVLVNDLDLRVLDASGTVHHPWTLDPANPLDPAVQTGRDDRNNIEQVTLDAPAPGTYLVEVTGTRIAEGPVQPFGIAAGPSLEQCSSAAFISTDRSRVQCEDQLGLGVLDCDLNSSAGVINQTLASVDSPSDPQGDDVTLLETDLDTGNFAGSIPVSPLNAVGVISVTEGDTITATYVDADDGQGNNNVPRTAEVTVDCTSPSFASITVQEIRAFDATLAVTLDEPASLTIRYGTSCAALDGAVGASLADTHEIRISGLTPETSYFYVLDAEDEAGNTRTDNNLGQCYSLQTTVAPDYHTQRFGNPIDFDGGVMTFVPDGSGDFYKRCLEPGITLFPTDPQGGTVLSTGEEASVEVDLAQGTAVGLYGQGYASIHVGPNGYLTFGESDSSSFESFSNHFDAPRIAGAFDNLEPGPGTISWKQLPDRVVVTWQNVLEEGPDLPNTFQIEMFLEDGRIRMSWHGVGTDDLIVGLSEGNDTPDDFVMSDLSDAPACATRPPFVRSPSVHTGDGEPVTIVLPADDDGLPGPPTYRITSLPVSGVLTDDGSGLPILAVPHDLAGGGASVTYTPVSGHDGNDLFTYLVDDGGVAPEGGESLTATVSITVLSPVVEDFLVDDSEPAGWTLEGGWEFGVPLGEGTFPGDPTSGLTGQNVFGYNLAGDYSNNMSEESLTTSTFSLAGITDARLQFARWLGVDFSTNDQAKIEVQTGLTWQTVWEHDGAPIAEDDWSVQTYDLSMADGQPAVRVRWVMGSTSASGTYAGWNLDDIRIAGRSGCTGPPGEASFLRFGSDTQTLDWAVAPFSGGSVPTYDVLRADSPDGFDEGTCLESNLTGTSASDSGVPASNAVYYYLIRAENDCGSGSLGNQSSGAPRSGVSCP